MTELTRFQRRLIRFQSPAFNFERASVALLSSLKQHRFLVTKASNSDSVTVSPGSEWRDPPVFRIDAVARTGARHG